MATRRVKTTYNRRAVDLEVTSVTGRLAENGAKSTQSRIRRLAPRRTGALAESFEIKKTRGGAVTTYVVSSPLDYADYQNRGTGPIFPKAQGGVLVFKVGGRTVYARHTKGVPATHYLDRAYAQITKSDFL